ncbi:MAG: OmpA family protein, partial [Myxococcaceae bacterium]
ACPDAAGEDANGCALVRPVETPVVEPAPTNAALKDGRIELKGTVYFETSRAELQPRSFPLLDEVASVMKAHPEVKVVRIEGHTDDRGGAAFNQPLSAARARAVKTYLEKAGIEPARLEAQGFGFSKPIAPNTTADGREKNRRVEFIVIE